MVLLLYTEEETPENGVPFNTFLPHSDFQSQDLKMKHLKNQLIFSQFWIQYSRILVRFHMCCLMSCLAAVSCTLVGRQAGISSST